MWASLLPAKKAGQPMPRWVTQDTSPVSAIRMERCPPSAWTGVRHHGGMLPAISLERCPRWHGIRTLPLVQERFRPVGYLHSQAAVHSAHIANVVESGVHLCCHAASPSSGAAVGWPNTRIRLGNVLGDCKSVPNGAFSIDQARHAPRRGEQFEAGSVARRPERYKALFERDTKRSHQDPWTK